MNLIRKLSGGKRTSPTAAECKFSDGTGKLDLTLTLFTDTPFPSMEEAFLHLIEVQEYIVENRPVKAFLLGLIATSILFSKGEDRGSGHVYSFKIKELVAVVGEEEIFSSPSLKSFSYERAHELRGRRSLLRVSINFEISGIYGDPLLTVFLKSCDKPESLARAASYLKLWRLQMKDHKRGTQFLLL